MVAVVQPDRDDLATGANNIVGIQRRDFDYNSTGQDYQLGFNWDVDRLRLTGFGSLSKLRLINNTNLVSLSTSVSGITVDRRNDAGLPVIVFPEAFDPADLADYAAFGRRGADGQLLVQSGPTVQYRPGDQGSREKQIKLDADYDTRDLLPFITSVEYGGQYRFQNYISYLGGGARLLRPAVTAVPAAGIVASPAARRCSPSGGQPRGRHGPDRLPRLRLWRPVQLLRPVRLRSGPGPLRQWASTDPRLCDQGRYCVRILQAQL